MCLLLQKKFLLRVVENNDWVIYSITAVIVLYVVSSRLLNKDVNFWEYLKMSQEDASNVFINWLLVSISYVFIISVFLSQYIPIVPKFIAEYVNIGGFTLNKFGFIFSSLLIFYGVKCAFGYLFYMSTANNERWKNYVFNVNKFFGVLIILVCALTIFHYFYPVDRNIAFNYYIWILIFFFCAKIAYLLFNPNPCMPKEWYYKFLYICTLQILPYLVVWKFLFF